MLLPESRQLKAHTGPGQTGLILFNRATSNQTGQYASSDKYL